MNVLQKPSGSSNVSDDVKKAARLQTLRGQQDTPLPPASLSPNHPRSPPPPPPLPPFPPLLSPQSLPPTTNSLVAATVPLLAGQGATRAETQTLARETKRWEAKRREEGGRGLGCKKPGSELKVVKGGGGGGGREGEMVARGWGWVRV